MTHRRCFSLTLTLLSRTLFLGLCSNCDSNFGCNVEFSKTVEDAMGLLSVRSHLLHDRVGAEKESTDGESKTQAIPDLVNVRQDGNTYTNEGEGVGSAYPASAVWARRDICVSAGQTNKHVRIGLTTNADDNPGYPNGKFVGLFPSGRLYKPSGAD